jgi:SAM-dependent methyltransferase
MRALWDYTKYINWLLLHPTTAAITIRNDYQPKIFDITNRNLVSSMNTSIRPYFDGKIGICIGGKLDWLFSDYLKKAAKVINVDLVDDYPGSLTSPDFLTDASRLYFAEDDNCDFVCSSHVLEHLSNPIRALKEWIRVLKPGGIIYCAVPDKRFTFDHKRKRTTLRHLEKDYQENVVSKDLSHLKDYYINYDCHGFGVQREQIINEVQKYYHSTSAEGNVPFQPHHHVFVKRDLPILFQYVGLKSQFVALRGITIHILGRKISK